MHQITSELIVQAHEQSLAELRIFPMIWPRWAIPLAAYWCRFVKRHQRVNLPSRPLCCPREKLTLVFCARCRAVLYDIYVTAHPLPPGMMLWPAGAPLLPDFRQITLI